LIDNSGLQNYQYINPYEYKRKSEKNNLLSLVDELID